LGLSYYHSMVCFAFENHQCTRRDKVPINWLYKCTKFTAVILNWKTLSWMGVQHLE
jgi:hypothetical protein